MESGLNTENNKNHIDSTPVSNSLGDDRADTGHAGAQSSVTKLPHQEDSTGIPFQSLDERQIHVERISNAVFTAGAIVASIVGILIRIFVSGVNVETWLLAAGLLLLCIALGVAGWFWPPLDHRYTRWRLSPMSFEVHRGVIFRHQISVPVARVQHADVSQGPLQRSFQLGTLTLHTAGTQNASVGLSGLAHERAIALRDELIRQRRASDVV